MIDLKLDGPIYTALLKDAEKEGKPYDEAQKDVIRRTVEKLSANPTSSARPGMLLGRIQSGKTKTFLGVIALAADNGFDLFIVLTKGTQALSEQTYKRLKQAYQNSIDEDLLRVADIMAFPSKLTKHEQQIPLIIVAKKQVKNIERLKTLLFDTYPALGARRTLIIDDEADFASIGFKRKDEEGFAEMQKIMSQMDDLRKSLAQSAFLQVTATPYSLYLQPKDVANKAGELFRPTRPAFTELVPIHKAYIGGDFYFEHENDKTKLGSYIYEAVESEELDILAEEDRRRFKIEDALVSDKIKSLRAAVVGFAVGGVIRRLQQKHAGAQMARYSFVVHTMARRASHEWQERIVEKIIELLIAAGEAGEPRFAELVKAAYEDFQPSVALVGHWMPDLKDVISATASHVGKIQIEKVNSDNAVKQLLDSDGQLELRNALNIFIGGSILDRGLTIGNLIGFYYGRRANRLQQDTVLQHHRMYGARPIEDMAVTRFYTSAALYQALKTIHEFDSVLRSAVEAGGADPIAFICKQGQSIIPCSPNKILATDVTSLRPGKRLVPSGFQTHFKTYTAKPLAELDERVKALAGEEEGDPVLIDVAEAERLLAKSVELFDPEANEGAFNLDAARAALKYVSSQCPAPARRGKALLLVRRHRKNNRKREGDRFVNAPDTAHVEGEIAKNYALDVPMLMLFRQEGSKEKGWRGSEFYWPVIYMPQYMRPVIFANDVNDFDEDDVLPVEDDLSEPKEPEYEHAVQEFFSTAPPDQLAEWEAIASANPCEDMDHE
jgi:hypothetical protein